MKGKFEKMAEELSALTFESNAIREPSLANFKAYKLVILFSDKALVQFHLPSFQMTMVGECEVRESERIVNAFCLQ